MIIFYLPPAGGKLCEAQRPYGGNVAKNCSIPEGALVRRRKRLYSAIRFAPTYMRV